MSDQTEPPKDSLGQLPNSKPTSSENSPNSKLPNMPERTEYRKAGRAGVLRVIQFMSDIKGEPWGKGDDEAAARFKDGWTMLIGDLPEKFLMEAAAEFLKQPGRKWPMPGDLREYVKKIMPEPERPARHAHDVVYDYSKLPPHVIEHRSARRLAAMGCSPEYIEWHFRDRALTREAKAKVDAMSPETLRRLGLDDHSLRKARGIMATRGKITHLDGATSEFRKLVGEDTEDTTPNQPQSPPTATDDFDGCSDGLS